MVLGDISNQSVVVDASVTVSCITEARVSFHVLLFLKHGDFIQLNKHYITTTLSQTECRVELSVS